MYRVRTLLIGGNGGQQVTTMYFNPIGGLTAADAAAAVGVFWSNCKAVISNGYTMTVDSEVASIDIATGEVTGVESVTGASHTGTVSGDLLPGATQGLLRWRTGIFIGGKEVRGRTFIPGPTEAHNSAGRPDANYRGTVVGSANAMMALNNADFLIYSRKHHEAIAPPAWSCWTEWAELRSRRS